MYTHSSVLYILTLHSITIVYKSIGLLNMVFMDMLVLEGLWPVDILELFSFLYTYRYIFIYVNLYIYTKFHVDHLSLLILLKTLYTLI